MQTNARGMIRGLMLCLALALGWAGPASARPPAPVQTVPYGPDPAQVLLLFPAAGPGPHPLVLFVHGGGWVRGTPMAARGVAPALNAAGYTVISAGYRLFPQVSIAEATGDVAQALAFILHDPARFGVSGGRVALAGHSSGATLAALLATDPHYLRQAGVDPARVAAVYLLDGVYDIGVNVTRFKAQQRREVFGTDPADWRRYSPVTFVPAMTTHPRFCFAHENTDPRFDEQAAILVRALQARGQTVDDVLAPGLGHMDLLRQASNPDYPVAGFAARCLAAALPAR